MLARSCSPLLRPWLSSILSRASPKPSICQLRSGSRLSCYRSQRLRPWLAALRRRASARTTGSSLAASSSSGDRSSVDSWRCKHPPALRRFFVAWASPNQPLRQLRHITARGWMQTASRRKAEWGCFPGRTMRKTEPASARCRVVALSVNVLIAAASAFFARVLFH